MTNKTKLPKYVQLRANRENDGHIEPAQHRGEVEFYSIYLGEPGSYQWVADFGYAEYALNAVGKMELAFYCKVDRSQYDTVMATPAPKPQPKGHPHAALIAEYAKDAAETDKPWERWEARIGADQPWVDCIHHPAWQVTYSFRRKPAKAVPARPTHCPFCGGSDIELTNDICIDLGNSGAPEDIDEYRCRSESCGRFFWSEA